MWRGRLDVKLAMSYCYFASIFSWVYSFSQGSVLLLRAGDQLTEQQPLSMLLNLPLPSTMSGASCNKRTRDNGQWHSCRQRNIIITHSFSAFSAKIVHDVICMNVYQKVFFLKKLVRSCGKINWKSLCQHSIQSIISFTKINKIYPLHHWRMAVVQLFWYPIDSAIWRICKDCQKTLKKQPKKVKKIPWSQNLSNQQQPWLMPLSQNITPSSQPFRYYRESQPTLVKNINFLFVAAGKHTSILQLLSQANYYL